MLMGISGSDMDVKGWHKLVRCQAKQTCQPSTETNVGQSKTCVGFIRRVNQFLQLRC